MFGKIKIIIGALALGFIVFLIVSVVALMVLPKEYFRFNMVYGPILWVVFSVLMYPVSKKCVR